jgi:4'-phosphopantetheinyl transferase
MTWSSSLQACDILRAAARDVTPSHLRGEATVLFVPDCHGAGDAQAAKDFAAVLSQEELRRADRLKTRQLCLRFLKARAFRRYCGALMLGDDRPLSTVDIRETEKGRPVLVERPDAWMSFSACSLGHLAAWSWSHAIGVDIEDRPRSQDAHDLARFHFAKAEADAIAGAPDELRNSVFSRFWTLKEAALKSIGEGLPYGLDAFQFALSPVPRVTHAPAECGGIDAMRVATFELATASAALALRDRS